MAKMMKLKPTFVKTKNVRNFESMMEGLALGDGEGRLGMVFGQAGRGKTRTTQWWAANNAAVYMRITTIMRGSELEFLASMCRELGNLAPPKRKGSCFTEIIDNLLSTPRPVFMDELEKLPGFFLDLVRDISDLAMCPFIMVGEEELTAYMKRNRRVWSRTFQQMEFLPIGVADIIGFAKEAANITLTTDTAAVLHAASAGDFRLVKRDLLSLMQIAAGKGTTDITVDMAKMAVKSGVRGE
jgi:hypothetical protein